MEKVQQCVDVENTESIGEPNYEQKKKTLILISARQKLRGTAPWKGTTYGVCMAPTTATQGPNKDKNPDPKEKNITPPLHQ